MFSIHHPRRALNMVIRAVKEADWWEPMLGSMAAPEIAMALPRVSTWSADSLSLR